MSAMKTLSALFLAAALAGAIPTPGAPVALARAEAAQALISTREAISAALRAYPGAEALDARLVDGGRGGAGQRRGARARGHRRPRDRGGGSGGWL